MYNDNHSHKELTEMRSASSPLTYAHPSSPRISVGAIAGIVAAHVAVLALLTTLNVVPLPPQLTTLMVQMITPPAASVSPAKEPTPTPVEKKTVVRPRPTPVKPAASQPLLAAQGDAPGPTANEAPAKETPAPAPAAAAPASAAPAGGGVSQPRFDANYLLNPAPAYPALSRKMGEEGRVVLRVLVDAKGRPTQIEIRTGSASQRLDQAAQDAVWRWKFVPAKRGDEAVEAWVLVPIVFNLRS
jgi:protein TonB